MEAVREATILGLISLGLLLDLGFSAGSQWKESYKGDI